MFKKSFVALLLALMIIFAPVVAEAQGSPTAVTRRAQSIANSYSAGYGWTCTHQNKRCWVTVPNGSWYIREEGGKVVVSFTPRAKRK